MRTIDREAVGAGISDLEVLWQPIMIGGLEIKNRVLLPAHGTSYTRDSGGGLISERYARYLERRAEGGAGLIVTMAAAVDPRSAGPSGIHLFDERNIPLARDLTRRVQKHGARIFTQLYHGGYHADNSIDLNWSTPVSASALASPTLGRTAHALTEAEIAEIVELYGRAAANAKSGGFDGVELSAGHGYLVCQFLSPLTNRREDRYGGSVENRARFAIEIAQSVRRHAGRDFALGIRLSYDEYLGEAGLTPDVSDELLREISGSELFDYVSVSGGNYHTMHHMIPPSSSGLVANRIDNSARAKAIVGDSIPVLVAGAIRTVEVAAAVLASGSADMVAMARAHIADPDLVKKAQEGRAAEIRHCIGSNTCWKRASTDKYLACSVNPHVGREGEWPDGQAASSRFVVIVGGGPAGLKAAVIAAERGHRVTLLERQGELGGQFRHMRVLPGRAQWATLTDDLTAAAYRLGVDVRLGVDATPELISDLKPDQVIVATGARFDHSGYSSLLPFQLSGIGGASDNTVLDPISVLENPALVGKRVVVMEDRGDYTALGIATLLAERGHQVELVTPRSHIGANLYASVEAPWVVSRAVQAGVRVTASSYLSEVSPGSVTINSVYGGESRKAEVDSVVVALMRQQNDELTGALAQTGIPTQAIGDCDAPGDVDEAVFAAEKAARLIK
jgi:2,4-dienoyl-CoA reductase-like NADH-dependent reductase (Old Yellow Enzyme family)/thioredoxin reductase